MNPTRPLMLCLSLVSGTALANPIMTVQRLSAEPVGGSHVRLSFLTNYYPTPPRYTTYGTSHSGWFTTGDSSSADTGSGMQTMQYQYLCDCHVPGWDGLVYKVGFKATDTSWDLTATVSTPSPAAPATACDAQCALADGSGAGGSSGSGGTGGTTGGNDSKGGGGGCAIARHAGGGMFSALLALGLVALGLRRRR